MFYVLREDIYTLFKGSNIKMLFIVICLHLNCSPFNYFLSVTHALKIWELLLLLNI